MDVTPQLLKDIEFREKFRGYDPDEVDDFLERVGVAFAELAERLRIATERAEKAEVAVGGGPASLEDRPGGGPHPTTAAPSSEVLDAGTLTRTLVLAQQTADAAIAEAREEAAKLRTQAETEADELRTKAETDAEQLRTGAETESEQLRIEAQARHDELIGEAESEVERRVADATDGLSEQVAVLAERRDQLAGEATEIEAWVEDQRVRLKSVIDDLGGMLDRPGGFAIDRPPPVTVPDADAAPTLDLSDGPSEPTQSPLGSASVDDLAGAETGARATVGPDPEPATEISLTGSESASTAIPEQPSATTSGDSFLEELRRAVEAPSDATADEDRALTAFFEQEDDPGDRSRRFGRRR